MTPALAGLLLMLLAGALGGSLFVPMKKVRGWAWENTWLAYSCFGYFLAPWIFAWATVPHLSSVYGRAGVAAVVGTVLFGFGWGLGVVLYGLAVDRVGLSVTSGIILGSSVALGSLVPLLWLSAEVPGGTAGSNRVAIVAADLAMLAGVLLCARAGALRDRAKARGEVPAPTPNPSGSGRGARSAGILLCLISGALAPLLNIALVRGRGIVKAAEALGATDTSAPNAVWALAVGAGALPSLVYCAWKLDRNRTWRSFAAGAPALNTILCLAMGGLFMASTMLYGSASARMGRLGPVVGWPVYMSLIILTSNLWGWLFGEWSSAGRRASATMAAGVLTQVAAMAILGANAS